MKKVKEFLLSIILPRKMYRHHSMKVIYSVFVFILSAFLLLFSINLSTKRFMKDMIGSVNFEENDYKVVNEIQLPKYRIAKSNSGGYYLDVEEVGEDGKADNFKGVFEILFEDSKNNQLKLNIVFDESCDLFGDDPAKSVDKDLFDLNGDMTQTREDKTTYLLYIFTKKSFYYLYDLGQEKDSSGKWVDNANTRYGSYEMDNNGAYKYYLPTDVSEVMDENGPILNQYGNYDTSLWTTETTKDAKTIIDGKEFSAQRRIKDDMRYAIYNGEYVYGNIDIDKINAESDAVNFGKNNDIKYVLTNHVELMAEADANIQKSMYSFFVVIINIVFPLVWVFITWLLSRKFVMNKFKEYYAICSITYITTSILGFILGFFIKFDTLMFILLIIELIYYIFVTFRINTDPNLLNPKDEERKDDSNDNNKPEVEQPAITFKKIKSDDAYHVE